MRQSLPSFQLSDTQLIRRINWVRASGRYVLRDPHNKDLLLYLDEKHYTKMVISAVSTDVHLEVLATPDDTLQSCLERFQESSGSSPSSSGSDGSPKGSPFSDSSSQGTPLFSNWVAKSSKMFTLLRDWNVKDSMVEFNGNIKPFFHLYYRDVTSWLGLRVPGPGLQGIKVFSTYMARLYKYRGINNVILVLKITLICTLNYIAGTPLKSSQDLGQRIRLTNGLPASLPLFFRQAIRRTDLTQIRVIVTLLNAYKGFAGIYKKPDMATIEADRATWATFNMTQEDEANYAVIQEIKSVVPGFWKDMNPNNIVAEVLDSETPTRIRQPLTVSAGPNHSISMLSSPMDALALKSNSLMWNTFKNYAESAMQYHYDKYLNNPTPENRVYRAFPSGKDYIDFVMKQSSGGIHPLVWYIEYLVKEIETSYTSFGMVIFNFWKQPFKFYKRLTMEDLPPMSKTLETFKDFCSNALRLGKLAIKHEPAGKVRVFAIVDYWTQLMLRPLHKSMFEVLRQHPCDATFDQLGKVVEFQKRNYRFFASYDLKSATDLIPKELYILVLGHWINPDVAADWSDLLTQRQYWYTPNVSKPDAESKPLPYVYERGQPMGALSSWAGLALIHHFLVFYAASLAGVKHFRDYLVLGDDLVIANKAVADSYVQLCTKLGVTIGMPKSYVSNTFFQFASQECFGQDNISPISLKEVLSIAAHSYYFKSDFHLSERLEFVRRILRKGFISESLVSFIRASYTRYEWGEISKAFTKGIMPMKVSNFLTSHIWMLFLIKEATMEQFMASVRGDYRLFTGKNLYMPKDKLVFLLNLTMLISGDVRTKYSNWFESLRLANTVAPTGFKSFDRFVSLEIDFRNSVNQREWMSTMIEFEELQGSIEELWLANYWSNLTGHTIFLETDVDVLYSLARIQNKLQSMKTMLDAERNSLTNLSAKSSYMSRLQLSLKALMLNKRKGNSLSWEMLVS